METRGTYKIGSWDAAGEATLEVRAGSIDEAMTTALTALALVAAGEGGDGTIGPEPGSDVSVPIRGQGADLGEVLFQLAGDMLAQIDVNGTGLRRVRLDGLLDASPGFTAWGYALGAADGPDPATSVSLTGTPTVTSVDGATTIEMRISKGA
ncbi:MAG: hypothetical protein WKF80_08165 [Thermomicrobiales bacterium]